MAASIPEALPYAWPWHGNFQPGRAALLVLHDGLEHLPGGPMWAQFELLLRECAQAGMALIALPPAHGPEAGLIAPDTFEVVVRRPHIGGFTGTDLDAELRRRQLTDLVFAGFPFEIGADTTMREANDLGYECLALADLGTGVTPETLSGALASIRMSGGIFGATATTGQFLALLGCSGATQARHHPTLEAP